MATEFNLLLSYCCWMICRNADDFPGTGCFPSDMDPDVSLGFAGHDPLSGRTGFLDPTTMAVRLRHVVHVCRKCHLSDPVRHLQSGYSQRATTLPQLQWRIKPEKMAQPSQSRQWPTTRFQMVQLLRLNCSPSILILFFCSPRSFLGFDLDKSCQPIFEIIGNSAVKNEISARPSH